MAESITTLLQRHQLTPDDIAMVIPHQANQRILDATADRLGLAPGRMASVIGATATRRRPRCRWRWTTCSGAGKIKRGDLVVFVAVGAGFTVGSSLVRWQ